jgi:FkbM family methyltransferase
VRAFLRGNGFDVVRWPHEQIARARSEVFNRQGVQTVVDVGANEGQYGLRLREWGFSRKIVSFEPLAGPYARLEVASASDPLWFTQRAAVGAETGSITINVAANEGASSSALPMLKSHVIAAPHANYIGRETCNLVTLDSVGPSLWRNERLHLKVDVQGFEGHVIRGAARTLQQAVSMELEVSFVPLYEGGMLFPEALDVARDHGFVLAGINPGFGDPATLELLQADVLFVRQS